MRYWVFHEEQLAEALAAFEARRIGELSGHDAKDWLTFDIRADTKRIAEFLASPEAQKHLGGKA